MSKIKNPIVKRLAFLRSFFSSLFVDINNIPPRVIPPGRLKMNLHTDDMSLSAAQRIIQHFGYVLDIQMIPRIYNPRPREYYQVNHAKRLSFLRDFIHESGHTLSDAAITLGLSRDSLTYWFKKDDIQLSRIYDIAMLFDADLEISILPIRETDIRVPKRTMTLVIKNIDALSCIDKRQHARGRTVES